MEETKKDYERRLKDLETLISALEKEKALLNRELDKYTWTPMEDHPPEEYGEYLVAWRPSDRELYAGKTCFMAIMEYEPETGWITGGYDFTKNVEAWMELPEQYEVKE